MKKNILIFIAAFLPIIMFGQVDNKMVVKPYGFIKGDMVYATASVYSWGNPANNYLSAPQLAGGVENPALGFTAQHTRFGFKVSKGGDIKIGGKIELDFYGGAFDANGKPRIRQAFASVAKGNLEMRIGQQWDIFSPINASTNNTNGNMWYAGNRGFRRAQIQFIYKIPKDNIVPTLQLSIGEATKEGAGLGIDNKSAMPLIQGRLSAKINKKYVVGVYFVNANFSPDPDSTKYDFGASGFGADVTLPLHKFLSLKGEVNMGTNLNNCNLFNIAGNGAKDVDKESLGIWLNATSKINKYFVVVVGFGMDQNQTDNLLAGSVESNTVIYGDLIFPITKEYSLALEIENITTTIKDGDDLTAVIFNISGKINF